MRFLVLLSCVALASSQYHYAVNSPAHTQHAPSASYATNHNLAPIAPVLPVEYNKAFYTYAAPAQEFNDDAANNEVLQSLRRNVRVLFIRGPDSNGLENAILNLARASSQDHTAIYVLNKQADVGALAQQLQGVQGQSQTKPEVHFVRYRTEADAVNAQRAIQSQYDTLPGLSTSHADGSAPVINFASAPSAIPAAQTADLTTAGAASHTSSGQSPQFAAHAAPSNNYLPPHHF